MEVPTVYTLKTRLWGDVPLIAIRMGPLVRLVGRPDFEKDRADAGKPLPAWFEAEDFVAPGEFEQTLRDARKEIACR